MAQPWQVLDSVATEDGTLELRRRGERDYLILVDNRVLMNSASHGSEAALGQLACRELQQNTAPRVLLGGLGMGYTLRAVLDALPSGGRVKVAELNPVVVEWCRGPLAHLIGNALGDPRVNVEIVDVAQVLKHSARGAARYDAVILDLYLGPHAGSDRLGDPFFGRRAIETTRSVLQPGGVFAVWGEDYDRGFEKRLGAAGFHTRCERPGRGGYRHTVYLARAPGSRPRSRPGSGAGRPAS